HRAAVAMVLVPCAARDRSAVRRPPLAPRVAQIEFAARMAHKAAPTQKLKGNEWRAVGALVPYLLEYKWRVALAMACLITAKLANVGVPLIMKQVVDHLDVQTAIVAVPVALLAIYGILRFSTTLFGDLRGGDHLYRLHGDRHRMAHGDPPPGERARFESEHARDRQPAELRDREVLRQRGFRGPPLRRKPAQVRIGGGEKRGVARAPQ